MNKDSVESNEEFAKRLREVGLAGTRACENLRRAFLGIISGFHLDMIGGLYGIKRRPSESVGDFRERLKNEQVKKLKFK